MLHHSVQFLLPPHGGLHVGEGVLDGAQLGVHRREEVAAQRRQRGVL